jgi:Protein of unknown function (DUF4232)
VVPDQVFTGGGLTLHTGPQPGDRVHNWEDSMNLGIQGRRRLAAAAAIASVAVGIPVAALAASAPRAATVACNITTTDVWFADAPNGTAGAIYYPVEFTNLSSSACTMHGYPRVLAITAKGKKLGPAAADLTMTQPTVTLKPNQTASAMLGILPPGFKPGCKTATAAGFRVSPPSETGSRPVLNLSFPICTNQGGSLTIYPVTKGIGVP